MQRQVSERGGRGAFDPEWPVKATLMLACRNPSWVAIHGGFVPENMRNLMVVSC